MVFLAQPGEGGAHALPFSLYIYPLPSKTSKKILPVRSPLLLPFVLVLTIDEIYGEPKEKNEDRKEIPQIYL
jgi:hypothetical protein